VDTKHALARIRHHFESIRQQPTPPRPDLAEAPPQAERRSTIDDALARLPRVDLAWRTPPSLTPDHDALTVLANVLSSGRSSRFFEAIVRQAQLASNVFAFAGDSRGPGLFRVIGTAVPGRQVADLEAAIHTEIERIKAGPIETWELEKARNSARRSVVQQLGSSLQRAILLSQFALLNDDPGLINTRAERLAAVTAEDVRRVARQYLSAENRTVVITQPQAAGPVKGAQ